MMDSNTLRIKIAQTDAELESAFRLRYQVFGSELGDLDPAYSNNGLEYDSYDLEQKICTNFIAIMNDTCVGVIRIIFDSPVGFSIEKRLDQAGQQQLSLWRLAGEKIAEGSRFAVAKEYRSHTDVAQALMKVSILCALAHNVTRFIGSAKDGTCTGQSRLAIFESFGFKPMGTSFYYDCFREYARPICLKLPEEISPAFQEYLKLDHSFVFNLEKFSQRA